jgi:hypothetical protein
MSLMADKAPAGVRAGACREVAFSGVQGHVLRALLQLPFVRYHRIQRGFVERPAEYRRFLRDVIGRRVAETSGPIAVFGCGEHTRILLASVPGLIDRVHCFADNNATLWHQERFGRPVLPPREAVRACEVFVLSTAVFQHVLRADLRRIGYQGPIIAMDDHMPPHWFLGSDPS